MSKHYIPATNNTQSNAFLDHVFAGTPLPPCLIKQRSANKVLKLNISDIMYDIRRGDYDIIKDSFMNRIFTTKLIETYLFYISIHKKINKFHSFILPLDYYNKHIRPKKNKDINDYKAGISDSNNCILVINDELTGHYWFVNISGINNVITNKVSVFYIFLCFFMFFYVFL